MAAKIANIVPKWSVLPARLLRGASMVLTLKSGGRVLTARSASRTSGRTTAALDDVRTARGPLVLTQRHAPPGGLWSPRIVVRNIRHNPPDGDPLGDGVDQLDLPSDRSAGEHAAQLLSPPWRPCRRDPRRA